jgi:predicted nucleotidyltransferase
MLLYETIAGSRLYGTNRPDSDTDIRGVMFEPVESLIGLGSNFEQQELSGDHVIYGLRKFLRLALDNNPNILDIFFAPKEYWLQSSPVWESIYAQRHSFLSQRLRKRYIGYAYSQLKKLEYKEEYKAKHAAHLLRLLYQAEEILTQGEFNPVLSGLNRDVVLKVLHEEIPIQSTIEEAQALFTRLENLPTHLPKNPTFDTNSIIPMYKRYINVMEL